MRNWPRTSPPIRRRIKERLSRLALGFASSLPKFQGGPIHNLQVHLEFNKKLHDYDLTSLPEGLDFSLLEVIYSDIFLQEDYDKLQAGLRNMIEPWKPWWTGGREDEDIPNMFASIRRFRRGGAWYNLNAVDFKRAREVKNPPKMTPELADIAYLQLTVISPSIVSLAISVVPSDMFQGRLRELLSRNEKQQTIIDKFSLRYGLGRSRSISATGVRQGQLERLFLQLQKEIVAILRAYIKTGLAMHGPVPSIQVFVTNREFENELPVTDMRANLSQHELAFWRTFGITPDDYIAYYSEWLTVFPSDSRGDDRYGTWKAVIDRKKFLEGESIEHYGGEQSAMRYLSDSKLESLATMASLQEHVNHIAREVTVLREELSPVLVGRIPWLYRLKGTAHLLFRMVKVRQSEFLAKRVRTELNEEDLKYHFAAHGFGGFVRRRHNIGDEKVSFVKDLLWQVDQAVKFIEAQLGVLKQSYEDTLETAMANTNLRVQNRIFWLTVAVVGLTLVLVALTWLLTPQVTRDSITQIAKCVLARFSRY